MEALNKAYSGRGVSFYYVLSREPHPGFYGFTQPDSLKVRQEYVSMAKAEMQSEIPWIIDDMENTMQKTYGYMPNSEFIVASDGILLESRDWADPKKLKKYLEKNIGPSGIADEVWDNLILKDEVRTSMSDNDEVPGSEVPQLALKDLSVKRLENKEDSIPFELKVGTLPAGITPGGNSRMYLIINPDKEKSAYFDTEKPPVILLSDVQGVKLSKEKVIAGKRNKSPDIYPHTLGVIWSREKDSREVAFTATVVGKMGYGESPAQDVEVKFRVSGEIPDPTQSMDEIPQDNLPDFNSMIPLKSWLLGDEDLPARLEAYVSPDPGDKTKGKIFFILKVNEEDGYVWNNLAAPQRILVKPVSGIKFEKSLLQAGRRNAVEDTEDRILVLEYSGDEDATISIEAKPELWICNDKEGWCRRFVAEFSITGKL